MQIPGETPSGLNLCDYFAAFTMQMALGGSARNDLDAEQTAIALAKTANRMANTMLTVRSEASSTGN